MKLKNILYYLAVIVLLTSQLWAQNTSPVVTNVTFSISGTTVTVHYDVADAEQSTLSISMEVSSNNGVTWDYNYGTATGAIGPGVAIGTAKTITWTYTGVYNNQFKIKIIADDLVGDQIYYADKIYNTVSIGTHLWLKENLDVGTMILGSQTSSDNGMIEKYCNNDDPANCTNYGGLYLGDEAMQYVTTPGAKGICPVGWHIPTFDELQTLGTAVSNNGNALKAIGQGTGSGAGTDASGFSALLTGYHHWDGYCYGLGETTDFWSTSWGDPNNPEYFELNSTSNNISSGYRNKADGFSVRCISDPPPPPKLSSPGNNSTNVATPPTLIWSASPGATSYTLQVSTSNAFTSFIYNQIGLTGTSQQISGLSYSTPYYWRVNYTNSAGTSGWSNVWNFTTASFVCGTTSINYSNKIYNTVQIGTQCWFKENLDVGIMILGSQTSSDNGMIEKYCYNNDPAKCTTYGGLYHWNEAMQYVITEKAQGICPTGWHIPTNAELTTLSTTVGEDGNALKALGQGTGSGAGTNTSGFSALLAGNCSWDGSFDNLGYYTDFWSSTEYIPDYAYLMTLNYYDNSTKFNYINEPIGFSIRCISDPPPIPNLSSPGNNSTNVEIPPTLIWSASLGATSYTLQVSTSNAFTSFIYNQSGLTETSKQISGLSYSTTSYWRVNASNSHGTSGWSSVWNFTTASFVCGTTTINYSGQNYHTVQIGTQCWLKENLDVGTRINGSVNQTNNSTIEKYCYNDDPANCTNYGGLYQWDEAMQYVTTPGAKGICPVGWHIPTNAEFQTLGTTVSNNGNALKAIGQGTGSGAGTNTSGFSALLAGDRADNGYFYDLGHYPFFWSSTELNASDASIMALNNIDSYIYFNTQFKVNGFSVRCAKD